MVFLGWLQLIIVLAAAGILAGATLSRVASKRWLEQLQSVAPGPRFVLLSTLACLPLALGAMAVTVAFAPSVLDAAGLVADHCAMHGGHDFHLCFVHGHPPAPSSLVLGGGLLVCLWLAAGCSDEFARLRRANKWSKKLIRLAHYDAEIDGWTAVTRRPIAVAIGFFRPKVCVSDGLRDALPARQFDAVLAHERAHASRYDSLIKFAVRLAAQVHFPRVRERLLEELELACEQSCDEAAADAVGDRLTVAEAILAVERTSMHHDAPEAALEFGAHALERRVRSMLEDDWERPAWLSIMATGGAVVGLVLSMYELLHHTMESLLLQVF